MLIGVDASSLLTPHPRGEGKTLLRLYEELALVKPDWRFLFFGYQTSTKVAATLLDKVPKSKIITFNLPGYRWNLWENLGLPFQSWWRGVDVLHCASSGGPYWSPVPIVMTVHDVIPLIIDDGLSPEAIRYFDKRLSAGCRIARRIIAVSNNTRQDLIRLKPIDPSIVQVIPWGADLGSSIVAKESIASTQGQRVVLGFGGGARRKNTTMLIQMFSHVAANTTDVVLKIIGVTNKKQRGQLEHLANELDLSNKVHILDFISEFELSQLYYQASCLVYISLYEGFGLPPLEAMSYGVPVIASNCSSIPEVVGDAGLLVDPNDELDISNAVLRILNEPDTRVMLSKKAIDQTIFFSWKAVANKTADLFEDAVASYSIKR